MTMHLGWRDVYPAPDYLWKAVSTSLTDNEASELRTLAEGARVLEVGSAYGFSAVVMALGGAESVLTVDPHTYCPNSLEVLTANLEAYRATNVAVRVDTFFNVAPELLPQVSFDLIFLDGDHSYETVKHDVTWAWNMLEPDGVLACHDYDEDCCPGVRQALDEFFFSGPHELVDTLAKYWNN